MIQICWQEYGDAAYFGECSSVEAAASVSAQMRSLNMERVIDCWSAFEKVCVTVDLSRFDFGTGLPEEFQESQIEGGRLLRFPCLYDGEDLQSVSNELGISVEKLIELHSSVNYQVLAIGFQPGFAYLGNLPLEISGVSRLASPRARVLPGSVALTEKMTAIYPSASPGGWKIIGRTPYQLVGDDYFAIGPQDRVQFFSIDEKEYDKLLGRRIED